MKKEQEPNQTFETYNHRILWRAAEGNLRQATSSTGDAKFFALGAMFLFFAAFEGYLNWLGTRIAPEIWQVERQFFSRSPFQGTLGKYRFLAKILCLPNPDPSQGSFQTAKDLLELRDMVAHPKAEAGKRLVKIKEGYFSAHYQSKLEKKVSPVAASRAKEHLKELAEGLHREAKQTYSCNIHESNAFGPILETEITDVSLPDITALDRNDGG
ncbi:MAG: hypothetical protein ACU88J_05645 [Gammaproteobacteria bacterium]